MNFQRMAFDDIPAMLALEQAAHAFPWTHQLFVDSLNKRSFNHVLCEGDQLVGFYVASHVAGEGSLLDIAVHPDCQRRGLGKALVQHLVEQAYTLGLEEIWLEVRASNTGAIALYQAAGFVETGRRKGYYPAHEGREDALVMCLPL